MKQMVRAKGKELVKENRKVENKHRTQKTMAKMTVYKK